MATLVFGLIVAAAPEGAAYAAGTLLGAAIVAGGSIIDSQLIFRPPNQKGARLGDLSVSGGADGDESWLLIGPENRVASTVIWMGEIVEHKHKHGGGLFGGSSYTTYTYTVDIAVAAAQQETEEEDLDDGVFPFDFMWANGRKFYDPSPDVDITSADLVISHFMETGYIGGEDQTPLYFVHMVITAPAGGPSLTQFVSGKYVDVSGSTFPVNNGSFLCERSYPGSLGTTVVQLKQLQTSNLASATTTNSSNEGPGIGITLFQDLPVFSSKLVTDVIVYNGSATQLPDPTMEAAKGAGLVPAYRGTSYAMLRGLHLTPFGNIVPAFNELARRGRDGYLVSEALSQVMTDGGADSDFFDVSDVPDTLPAFRGSSHFGLTTVKDQLAPIMLTYNIVEQQTGTGLRFFRRKDAEVFEIDTDKLGARAAGEGAPTPIEEVDVSELDLPDEIPITFREPARDWQAGSVRERIVGSTVRNPQPVDLPVVLTSDQARGVASRILWTARTNRGRVKFTLPPSCMTLRENDIARFTIQDVLWNILIQKVSIGSNYLVIVEGVIENDTTFDYEDWVVDETGASGFDDAIDHPANQALRILDIPPLAEELVNIPGFYFSVVNTNAGDQFEGSELYRSSNDSDFLFWLSCLIEGNSGRTLAQLAAGFTAHLDYKSSLTLQMDGETELETCTVDEMLAGANTLVVGKEILRFSVATPDPSIAGKYVCTVLQRGLFGTMDEAALHPALPATEEVTLLNDDGLQFGQLSLSDMGLTAYYKPVALGGDISEVESQTFTFFGATCRPMPVVCVRGFRHAGGANYWTVTFNRQSRTPMRLFAGFDPPLNGDLDQYEIEVRNSGDTATLNTYTVSGTTWVYTDAQQIADYGSVRTTFKIRIFQKSSFTPRGKMRKVTIS